MLVVVEVVVVVLVLLLLVTNVGVLWSSLMVFRFFLCTIPLMKVVY